MFSEGTRESFHKGVIDTGGSLLKPRFEHPGTLGIGPSVSDQIIRHLPNIRRRFEDESEGEK